MLPSQSDENKSHNSRHWYHSRQNTASKHVAHYLRCAEKNDQAETGSYQGLLAEHDNLRTAVQYAHQQKQRDSLQRFAWVLARPYGGYLSALGHWTELADLLTRTIALSEEAGEIEIAAAFRADLATLQLWQGALPAAQENYQAALAILKLAPPIPPIQTAVATIYLHLGIIAQQTAVYATARHHYQQALSLHKALDNQAGVAKTLHQLGSLAATLGELDEAQSFYDESLALSQTMGDEPQVALTTWNLGNLAYREGHLTAAEQQYQAALPLFAALDDRRNQAGVLHALGQIALDQGDVAAAHRYAQQSLAIKEELGHRLSQPVTLGLLGVIAYADGEPATAESLFRQAITLADAVGNRREANSQRFNLAALYELQGRLLAAEQLLQEVVAVDEQLSLPDLDKDRAALARVREKAARIV
jgi:tetratricopeptide (TPR) repeat protein